jgi:hypothetical protein
VQIKPININNTGEAYMFKSISVSIAFLLVFSITMQGCATIIHGSHQDLPIKTMPPDVIARIDTESCVTPCTLRVSRLAENIHFAIAGDAEQIYPLFKSVNTFEFYFGNIIFLYIGGAIDLQTGAKYTIEPVNIVLPNGNK